ncbi:MAG: riboflavin synthase [bacterium]|nr:riboflavin synthase [bacterium]
MFTGIIEELGKINRIQKLGRTLRIQVTAKKILEELKLGDSIAVNGVCLTVVKYSATSFDADIMPETVSRTTFAYAKIGERVNLERAMQLPDRVNGHFVTGHIDGVGKIQKLLQSRDEFEIEFSVSPDLLRTIVPKGSIAIDGISLTVVKVTRNGFGVSLIPFTTEQTTLGSKAVGSLVNIETDILAKYVQKQKII